MYDYQLVINGNMQPIEHIFLIKVERGFLFGGGCCCHPANKSFSLTHSFLHNRIFDRVDSRRLSSWGLGPGWTFKIFPFELHQSEGNSRITNVSDGSTCPNNQGSGILWSRLRSFFSPFLLMLFSINQSSPLRLVFNFLPILAKPVISSYYLL